MPRKRELKAAAKSTVATADAALPEPPAKLKIVSTSATGGVFVDHFVPNAEKYKVIIDGDFSYSCYLMWSDIKENHNKFYVAQALEHSSGTFHLWTRYGRVGFDGVGQVEEAYSKE